MAKVKKPAKKEAVLKANAKAAKAAKIAALKKKDNDKQASGSTGSTTASTNSGPTLRRVSFKQPVATISYPDGSKPVKGCKGKPVVKTIEKVKKAGTEKANIKDKKEKKPASKTMDPDTKQSDKKKVKVEGNSKEKANEKNEKKVKDKKEKKKKK